MQSSKLSLYKVCVVPTPTQNRSTALQFFLKRTLFSVILTKKRQKLKNQNLMGDTGCFKCLEIKLPVKIIWRRLLKDSLYELSLHPAAKLVHQYEDHSNYKMLLQGDGTTWEIQLWTKFRVKVLPS